MLSVYGFMQVHGSNDMGAAKKAYRTTNNGRYNGLDLYTAVR